MCGWKIHNPAYNSFLTRRKFSLLFFVFPCFLKWRSVEWFCWVILSCRYLDVVFFVLAGKKSTKRNACDDHSIIKKQVKVDLYHFVTTKLQALYAWLWKVWHLYRSSKLYFVFIARLLTWRCHPRPMTLRRVRLPGHYARRRDSHNFCLCFAPF